MGEWLQVTVQIMLKIGRLKHGWNDCRGHDMSE